MRIRTLTPFCELSKKICSNGLILRSKNFDATVAGGVPGRLKGRVSDASMVGCGGYANKHGAATTSGLGESIIKMTLAREVVYMMEGGQNAQVWF